MNNSFIFYAFCVLGIILGGTILWRLKTIGYTVHVNVLAGVMFVATLLAIVFAISWFASFAMIIALGITIFASRQNQSDGVDGATYAFIWVYEALMILAIISHPDIT